MQRGCYFNTICSATKERQTSAEETSKVDVMLVVGSKTSSNTTKLYEICKRIVRIHILLIIAMKFHSG